MNNLEYIEKAHRTYPDLGLNKEQTERLLPEEIGFKLNISHLALGLAGELGELVNCTGTELKMTPDLPNLKEELGDLYWYVANYCKIRDIVPPIQTVSNELPSERCFELLISSVAELVDIVKRQVAYNKEIDRANEMEAVYNIYAALELFESIYALDGDEIRTININKLRVRYPVKYSDEQAINRNTEEERKTLE